MDIVETERLNSSNVSILTDSDIIGRERMKSVFRTRLKLLSI